MFERLKITDQQWRIVRELSVRHSPPRINLYDAEVLDGYGDPKYANSLNCPIHHQKPEDVTRHELNVYAWVWPFMNLTDQLFYFYPVAFEYVRDPEISCIDSFLYSLDRHCGDDGAFKSLEPQDQDALLEGIRLLWHGVPIWHAPWWQCPNLQKLLGVEVTSDDLSDAFDASLLDAEREIG